MPYTETFRLNESACDCRGRWKPSAILSAMQDAAICHCNSIGLPREALEARGVAWILSRQVIEFSRLPAIGASFTLETCALAIRHLFFPRAHLFRDESGQVFGTACGLWMLMDLTTRKVVREPWVAERLPVETPDAPVSLPGTVRAPDMPQAPAQQGAFLPLFTDFDRNGHVNNTRYMDFYLNAAGFDLPDGAAWTRFDINYEREIRRGETVHTGLWREPGADTFIGRVADARAFAIRAKWVVPAASVT